MDGPTRRALLAALLSLGGAALAAAPELARGLDAPAPPLVARYRVTVGARTELWTLHRSADRVALLKGAVDEIWSRDEQGRIRFQRVFHDDAKVVDYSPGELATLGVQVDWEALARFVDPQALRALRAVSRSGRGSAERWRLEGRTADGPLRVDWLPSLQLPALLQRRGVRFELLQQAATARAGWPQPGVKSADYLHLDAADFGDQDYEAVVRKSEAMDIRLGWRRPHRHD